MPISRKDFDLGLDETMSKFFKTFSDNPDKAFTFKELEERWNLDSFSVVTILIFFIMKRLIKNKFIRSEYYFILA